MKILFFIFLSISRVSSGATSISAEMKPVPLVLENVTLFEFKARVGSISSEERVKLITARLRRLVSDRQFDLGQITISEDEFQGWDIFANETLLMVITPEDAKLAARPAKEIAQDIANRLKEIIEHDRLIKSPKERLLNSIYTFIITLGLFLILFAVNRVHRYLKAKILAWSGTVIRSIRIKSFELLPAVRLTAMAQWSLDTGRVLLYVGIFYVYVPLVLSLFPMTSNYSSLIFGYFLQPLNQIWTSFVGFIPNLAFIVVTILVVRYFLKVLRLFFSEIEKGNLQFTGFYQEWAEPTYQLARALICAFSIVIIFPYIPGSSSPAFQGVTVFLGVIVSFGSTSAVANIIAGLVLTYMRSFRIGDRVKIADTMGDIVEKTILVTRIRTVKNVDITIPNSIVLNSHIINFSTSAKTKGLILHTEITIGYDAPWQTVHKLLIDAAIGTRGILHTPAPFVLQTSLDDSYVRYEINAFTHMANSMAGIYSELRQNIQDSFNKAGVEIMSPSYHAMRDGNNVTIPLGSRPKDY
ncbi:MAG: mechanosensitive ion channel, partial [Proteobacteria bacterium]|nr:mechanosensitive ion channel [Pseudomonadota bacterium]